MTELKRLEISGIRSFKENPEDINKQSIDFDGPVTLITGENGTGKTTIIEALKFATMGKCTEEMITDPNIWGKDSIESRVSLEFKSANQNSYKVILTPSIKKTQSNKKGKSFERGECEVITTTPEGVETTNYINISKDVEIQLPNNFGVSPPIIENVIFCHQKDSCWPIDSSARELKEKFDQIFGAEKYNGAIKELKGTLKKLNEDFQNQNTEVYKQIERQENYLRSEKKIIKLKQEIIDIDYDVNEKQMLFEQIDCQLNEYNKVQPSIDKINNEIQKLKGELTSDENNMKVLSKKIKNMQPKETCSSALENVTSLIQLKKDEQETKSKCLKESRLKQNSLEKEKDNLKREFEKISEDLNSAQSEQNFYLQKMRQFKDSYNSENLDDTLDQKRNAFAQADEDLKKLDGKILSIKDQEIRTNEISLSNHKAQVSALAKNIENFDSQLSKINDVDEETLKNKENTIKNIQKELNDFINSDKNPDVLSKIIENKTSEKNELNQQKQNLMAMKEKCDQNSDNVNKLKNADDQIRSATERINSHLKIIQDGLGDQTINSKDAKTKFSEKCSELNDTIKKLKSERLEINKNTISVSTNLQREQADLEKRENKAKIAKDNIDRENTDEDFVLTDNGESYKTHCELIENCLNEENDKLSRLNNSENVYKDFRNKAETRNSNSHHSCPLCEREFESDSDYEKFLSEHIDNFIDSLPKEIKKAQLNKNMYKNKLEKLKKIENDVKIYIDYQKNKDEWINNIQSLQKEEIEFTDQLKEKDKEIKYIEDALENLQKIAVNVDNLMLAITEEKNFSDLKERLLSKIDKDLPSVVDIQNQINEIDKEIDNLSNEITNLYKEQNQFTNEKNSLTNRIESLSQEYDHMKTDLANKESLIKKAEKQRDEISTHQQNIEQLVAELQKLRLEYKDLQTNFEKEKEEKTKQRDNAKIEFDNCKNLIVTIKQSQETLKKVESGEMAEYHTELKSKLDRKEEEYKKLIDEINKYNDENIELNKQILQLKEEEADLNLLDDYYKVKENSDFLHSQLKNLEDEKARMLSKFDDMNIKELTKQHREYSRSLIEAKTNKSNAEKNLEEEKAYSEEYAPSRKLLSQATIRLKSIELARSDITRYIKALDKTILEYHSQKMREINDTIETLWSNTYFGQDIDTIYIRCEEEKAKNAQYNYRVVMKKNGIELDMDRRCSAGQKMLASIIIRLALAQTFALNCGIIALDEPTTNLDEPNRKNLASQLIDLVNAQEDFNSKKTFQLIIITHSREFVQSLVEEGKIDCFYQITRAIDDSHHCSQIQKCYETNLVIGH